MVPSSANSVIGLCNESDASFIIHVLHERADINTDGSFPLRRPLLTFTGPTASQTLKKHFRAMWYTEIYTDCAHMNSHSGILCNRSAHKQFNRIRHLYRQTEFALCRGRPVTEKVCMAKTTDVKGRFIF